jgi:alkanesulfonate monooxygenase SsuD/methylene tetrahydromethanopterin reductase-like flavin-dependent oxidoreductase (luciferase family)
VGGESRPALRRTAELADGWYPLGSNPTFPMGTPEQLGAGLERLATYARRFGRDPSEIETIYRTHQFELTDSPAGSDRLPFVGSAEQIAADIRQYEQMGVSSLALDFQRQTEDLEEMLSRMERFATQVWPLV